MAQARARKRDSGNGALGSLRCAAALAALDCVPVGIVFVNQDRQVVAHNAAAAEISAQRDGVRISRGLLQLTNDHDDQVLGESVKAAATARGRARRRATRLLKATRPSGRQAFTLMVAPIVGEAPEDSLVAVFVGDPQVEIQPPITVLQQLYGLTPAEAKLASLLAAGLRVDDAAAELGISVHTARAQLKQVFTKTGTRRQAALMRLLLTGPAGLRIDKVGQSLRSTA